jgi:serine/threonine protein kinase
MTSDVALFDTTLRAHFTLSEAVRHATSLQSGDLLFNRYEIGDTLGLGGMGVVFEAFDRMTQEKIAVKVLRGDVGLTGHLQTRFLSEAKISRTLSHENIVRVYDVGANEQFYYLTMERLWGQSLRARMDELAAARQPFSMGEFNSIREQLIEALRFANRTLVHRDVKPENIWITREGVIKLMDFGIARVVDSNNTYTQMAIGTPRYMSPEQRDSPRSVDWRTDQYALGVVLHEVLTGKRPEIGMPPPHLLRKDIPRPLSDAIVMAMAPEPDARHASWQAFKEAFELQAPPKRMPWKVGAAALLLTTLISGAYFILQSGISESGGYLQSGQEKNAVAERERQERAAAAKQRAAELQAQQARERQAADDTQRLEQEAARLREEQALQADLQRQADAKRQAAADAKRLQLNEQRAEAERQEAAQRVEAERQAELERQAQLERERRAAEALVAPPVQTQAPEETIQQDKKTKRSFDSLIPPSF